MSQRPDAARIETSCMYSTANSYLPKYISDLCGCLHCTDKNHFCDYSLTRLVFIRLHNCTGPSMLCGSMDVEIPKIKICLFTNCNRTLNPRALRDLENLFWKVKGPAADRTCILRSRRVQWHEQRQRESCHARKRKST
uniref:Uncharacterized protein n=1 Tax=Trichogramma kaykai TaxID=54128 RepID=A0ABD2W8Q4_9HYME